MVFTNGIVLRPIRDFTSFYSLKSNVELKEFSSKEINEKLCTNTKMSHLTNNDIPIIFNLLQSIPLFFSNPLQRASKLRRSILKLKDLRQNESSL